MNEQLQQNQPQKLSFSAYANSPQGQKLISYAIKDPKKRSAFVTSIVSAVSANPELQDCTSPSIISAALQGVSLGLAPSPQLGQFYMVPFNAKEKRDKSGKVVEPACKKATFVMGYRGYIQLAYRSGQYLDIDARPVVQGEYLGKDKYTGRPIFEWIEDDEQRESLPVVGYMAYFELTNGARKVIYWSKEKMLIHADKYSPAFSKDAVNTARFSKVSFADFESGKFLKNDEWKYSSFWYKDFNGMACKTMLRQLITKWGPVSIEMQGAIAQEAQNDAAGVDYGAPEGFAGAALPAAVEVPELPQAEPDAPQGEPDEQVSLDDL